MANYIYFLMMEKLLEINPDYWSLGVIVIIFLGMIFPGSNIMNITYGFIIGAPIMIAGLVIHKRARKSHYEFHKKVDKFKKISNKGIYKKIRHPAYLGLILMYLSAGLLWGSMLLLILSFFISVLLVFVAIAEDNYLLKKFGKDYENYLRKTGMFFPKIR